ncbi:50S ribosomal protein L13, chloroplastic [Linum perenne]
MALLHGSSSIVLPSPSSSYLSSSSSNPSSPFVVGFSGASLQLSVRKSWAIEEKKEKREKKEKPPHIPLDQRWMVEESEVGGPDIWNTTWYPKAADHVNTEKTWYIVDATDKILGRLASTIAIHIRGKNLGTFTPSVDMGAFVIVVNAEKVAVSGKKRTQKLYRRHSGRPGGMTVETFDQLQQRIPERIIEHAVRGMLPKGRLGRALFNHLKVYKGPSHPHEAQMPIELPIRDKRIQKS